MLDESLNSLNVELQEEILQNFLKLKSNYINSHYS